MTRPAAPCQHWSPPAHVSARAHHNCKQRVGDALAMQVAVMVVKHSGGLTLMNTNTTPAVRSTAWVQGLGEGMPIWCAALMEADREQT